MKRIAEDLNVKYNCEDLSQQIVESGSWLIEFNVGDEKEEESVMLHIRGEEEPKEVLQELARSLKTRLLDCNSCEFIRFDKESGFEQWKKYRDEVIGGKQ